MHPDEDAPTTSNQSGTGPARSDIRRWQILSISIVGALAVITFFLSVLIVDAGGPLRTVSMVLAGICALIGVSFAVLGGGRR